MYVKKCAVWAACAAAAAVLFAGFFIMRTGHTGNPTPQNKIAVRASIPESPANPASTLFPELSSMHVTALTIATPERSFQFLLDTQGAVSVNGQQADSEIFSTLLDQIAELPVERYTAFKPQTQDLILTLVISSGSRQQTARFYEDGGKGEKTHIVLGSEESPEYRQTSGWRVGTLMMTCEGTRIQDINGNETPVIK